MTDIVPLLQAGPVHYLPIATTVLAAAFFVVLLRRSLERNRAHLWWWCAGVFFYGVGTALESAVTLSGNTVLLNKSWYIAGALLGGYPLAQGSVFLLLRRKTALVLTAITVPLILVTSALVIASPVDTSQMLEHKPSGAILEWAWVRGLTPLINGYAALFLIGGAILSAVRYARDRTSSNRVVGNSLIAVGAILPGIGGTMAKAGVVEALYIGELVGLALIWLGYGYCVRPVPLKEQTPERELEVQPTS